LRKGAYKEAPRQSAAEENLEVLPLLVVLQELGARGLDRLLSGRGGSVEQSGGLLGVLLDIERVARGLGDGQAD
jgi:hypothetical protein